MAIIAVDFDGTCVTHEYPRIGANIGAQKVLLVLVFNGHSLILFTMRSGEELKEAERWFFDHGIPLIGVNTYPMQKEWTDSPKAFAHLYIDDAALGCPLMYTDGLSIRSYVNWMSVRRMLDIKGFFDTPLTTHESE